jgi:hypothetical protein
MFSEIKNSYMQKKVLFSQNFMSFYRPQNFVWVIFSNMWGGESAIFAENMKKVGCVSFQKSEIFADIWGQIKN